MNLVVGTTTVITLMIGWPLR